MIDDTRAPDSQTLDRELLDVLVGLSAGVHRFAMYPKGHPALTETVAQVTSLLTDVLAREEVLALGVAYRQLVVRGATTDPRHPLLSDLARRMHDHRLGALTLERGIGPEEVTALLAALGQEPSEPGLGALPPDRLPSWSHAKLHAVGYDHLRMDQGEAGAMDRSAQLWLGLAQVSLATDQSADGAPDAEVVAKSIRAHSGAEAYDQAVVGYLTQLAAELKAGDGAGRRPARDRVSQLIRQLDDETLARLLDFGGDTRRRRRFVLDANESLSADSVVKLLQAAASTSSQTISHSMTRMLTKLAAHTHTGGRGQGDAEAAFRENVEALIANWSLDDPNPYAYTSSLDAMARAAPMLAARGGGGGSLAGDERILSMAIEIDAWGPTVEHAVNAMIESARTARVLELLQGAPVTNGVAEKAWALISSPSALEDLFRDPTVEMDTLHVMAAELGAPAIEPLLDLLAAAEERPLRRRVFDVLARLDEAAVARGAVQRLTDPRWFVQRNMLALLVQVPPELRSLDPTPWAAHEDPRVRREALALMLHDPQRAGVALPSALGEDDEWIVRLALEKVGPGSDETVRQALVDRVLLEGTRSDELRRAAAKTIRRLEPSPELTRGLMSVVSAGSTLLGRPRIASPSPFMLEALSILAREWPASEGVERLLEVARRSSDPDIRAAMEVPLTGSEEEGSGKP